MKFPRTSIAVSTFAATLIEAHTLSSFLEFDQACIPYSPMRQIALIIFII